MIGRLPSLETMIAFNCKPLSANPSVEPLVFEWDALTGAVTGPSAAQVKEVAADGGVPLHPAPAWHTFGAEPLKSRADLAAIVGHLHQLPGELAGDYPTVDEEPGFVEVIDAEGRVVSTAEVVF